MRLLDHCSRCEPQPHVISWQSVESPGGKEGRDTNPDVAGSQDEVYRCIHSFVYSSIYLASCVCPPQSCC